MKMFNGQKKNTGSKADSEKVREYILECLGSGELCRKEDIKNYLKKKKQCSLSEKELAKNLRYLVGTGIVWTPQKGYYIREEEESSGKVFWMLRKCRRKLEAVLFTVRTDKIKCDVDMMRELGRMKRIVESLMERTGAEI